MPAQLPERIKIERNRLRLTQAQIAKFIGIHRETWTLYEKGKMTPGAHVLIAFTEHGANAEYLLTGNKIPHTTAQPANKANSDKQSNPSTASTNDMPRTAEQVRAEFKRKGVSIASWAAENGFSYTMVMEVLGGRKQGLRGQSHRIMVKLGMKEGEVVEPGNEANSMQHSANKANNDKQSIPGYAQQTTFDFLMSVEHSIQKILRLDYRGFVQACNSIDTLDKPFNKITVDDLCKIIQEQM